MLYKYQQLNGAQQGEQKWTQQSAVRDVSKTTTPPQPYSLVIQFPAQLSVTKCKRLCDNNWLLAIRIYLVVIILLEWCFVYRYVPCYSCLSLLTLSIYTAHVANCLLALGAGFNSFTMTKIASNCFLLHSKIWGWFWKKSWDGKQH